ncbi:hypothetical protein M3Y14_34635 (plasmid) [Bacillus thuringiensis]|uniref:hypothetical protein n=1 Tax=Bacillus thuringiensis TaxID=1428 RepID=UPI0022244DD6|nr:hypothetical protein [Bacillus thuringiensis]UYX56120.1 hypothetical protein M3Y14_34635 [Bacillus thuringiensis]
MELVSRYKHRKPLTNMKWRFKSNYVTGEVITSKQAKPQELINKYLRITHLKKYSGLPLAA